MFSKKLSSVNTSNTIEAINSILRQLNYIQDELERRHAKLESRITALENEVEELS